MLQRTSSSSNRYLPWSAPGGAATGMPVPELTSPSANGAPMADVEAQRTTKGGQPAKGGDGDPAPAPSVATYARIKDFFAKMRGGISHPPPRPAAIQVALAFLGSVLGLMAVAALNYAVVGNVNVPLLLGCFGASCTLLFGMPALPPAQPRNVLGGMLISSCVGVICRTLMGDFVIIAAPMAVALSVVAMQLTSTIHPPGGAAALIIAVMLPLTHVDPLVVASTKLHTSEHSSWCIRDALEADMRTRFLHGLELGLATMMGTVVLLCIALFTNNLGPKRYPVYWWT